MCKSFPRRHSLRLTTVLLPILVLWMMGQTSLLSTGYADHSTQRGEQTVADTQSCENPPPDRSVAYLFDNVDCVNPWNWFSGHPSGGANRNAKSAWLPPGKVLLLSGQNDGSAPTICLYSPVPDLAAIGWSDRVEWAALLDECPVTPPTATPAGPQHPARFYEEPNFTKLTFTLDSPGIYDHSDLNHVDQFHQFSSVDLCSGCSIVLTNIRGDSRCWGWDESNLGDHGDWPLVTTQIKFSYQNECPPRPVQITAPEENAQFWSGDSIQVSWRDNDDPTSSYFTVTVKLGESLIAQAERTTVRTMRLADLAAGNYTIQGQACSALHCSEWQQRTFTVRARSTPTATPLPTPTATFTSTPVPVRCYQLSLAHQGEGAPLVADPPRSPGCDSGHYTAGTAITVWATPATGWTIAAWNGDDALDNGNDNGNDNGALPANVIVTMPQHPHTVRVIYAEPAPVSWTILIYAVGDNNLGSYLGWGPKGMLTRLKDAGAQRNVQVGILYDGPQNGDSRRYILNALGDWSGPNDQGELRMDDPDTLEAFLRWGYRELPASHYYLAILDHANGVLGIGEDLTTATDGLAYLTPEELRQAIDAGKQGNPLDILQIDGCSFGLLEDASIIHGRADYMIVSPNTGWGVFAYERYRQVVGQAPNPPSVVAGRVATTYAQLVEEYERPYTIAVFDMAHFEPLSQAVDQLGSALVNYTAKMETRQQELRTLRKGVQRYDAGDFVIEEVDSFVDLPGLASALTTHADPAIAVAATTVLSKTQPFILTERHSAEVRTFFSHERGEVITVDLSQSRGLAIYYPYSQRAEAGAYRRYVGNELFYWITPNWGWRTFLDEGLPSQQFGDPRPNEDRLIQVLGVEAPQSARLYLPLLQRE